jgi:hypothetical protein
MLIFYDIIQLLYPEGSEALGMTENVILSEAKDLMRFFELKLSE